MPKNKAINSVLVIGSGPIVIGQACEFDYAGVQACRALQEEQCRVILVNSNPATFMTDPMIADATYIEPLTLQTLEKIIAKEKLDALLPTMGGQTGLNLSLQLYEAGILDKYNIKLIGANVNAIRQAEDRELFYNLLVKYELDTLKTIMVRSLEEALAISSQIDFPVMLQTSYKLGGAGIKLATNLNEFTDLVELLFPAADKVLIQESVDGWKEFEFEVVRDSNDNCIIVCAIENIDPMGIHTGDSITVSPPMTLTDKEYQHMRDLAFKIVRAVGVDTGGTNVQFALNPVSGRIVPIEMNPRVSRSSALASKVTGYPIAYVATKIALGYTLDEITNAITNTFPSSFEPTLDYVVVKIPRFNFDKFPTANKNLTVAMKSIGEAMGIGRSFHEALQKALVSLDYGWDGLNEINIEQTELLNLLSTKRFDLIQLIAEAFRQKIDKNTIQQLTKYDPWFLEIIQELINMEIKIRDLGLSNEVTDLRKIKSYGFSHRKLARLTNQKFQAIDDLFIKHNIYPVFKKIDTCAAEFDSNTHFYYSSYEPSENADNESIPSNNKKIIILGSGPNRIGQGLEFDYSCTKISLTLQNYGIETIMINCNPSTVSTDYNVSSRLYFEPVDFEYVHAIIRNENQNGMLLGVLPYFGGQTALKLIEFLEENHIPLLGSKPSVINLTEDRHRFRAVVRALNIKQPTNFIVQNASEIIEITSKIGYPIIIRPSYVIGGANVKIFHHENVLLNNISLYEYNGPFLIEKFLANAIEIDVDAISNGTQVKILGIMPHIEPAGIHSGDSCCHNNYCVIDHKHITTIQHYTSLLGKELAIIGIFNIQFIIFEDEVLVLEVNARASRTLPFIIKTLSQDPFISLGAILLNPDQTLDDNSENLTTIACKMPVFSSNRINEFYFPQGPEMLSTGESMGIGNELDSALFKAILGAYPQLEAIKNIIIYYPDNDKKLNFHIQQLKKVYHVIEPKDIMELFDQYYGIRDKIVLIFSEEIDINDKLILLPANDAIFVNHIAYWILVVLSNLNMVSNYTVQPLQQ